MSHAFAPRFVDLVRTTTNTLGSGPLAPGSAVPGFRSFADMLKAGDQFYYCVQNSARPTEVEVGRGMLQEDGSIEREPITGSLVSLSAGPKTIALVAAAEWFGRVPTGSEAPILTASDRVLLGATTAKPGFPVVLCEGGRQGTFHYLSEDCSKLVQADPLQGIFIAPPIRDGEPAPGSFGAWVRCFEGPINVRWFGAVADDATDAAPAINAAFAVAEAMGVTVPYGIGTPPVVIPKGLYYCASSLVPQQNTQLLGDGGKGYAGGSATLLRFAPNVHGIDLQSAIGTRAPSVRLKGLHLKGGYAGTEGEFHGVAADVSFVAEDLYVELFQGDAFNITASSDQGNGYLKNSNCFALNNCTANSSRNGLFIQGADSNAGYTIGLNACYNRQWGIRDESFLGNTHIAAHADGNGISHRSAPYTVVSHEGRWFAPMPGQAAAAATTPPPSGENDTAVWAYCGYGGVTESTPAWATGMPIREGGSYSTTSLNASNVFVGCYAEGGQGPAQFVAPTMVLGGSMGRVLGSASYFRNNGGYTLFDRMRTKETAIFDKSLSLGGQNGSTGSNPGIQCNSQSYTQFDFHSYEGGFSNDGYLLAYRGLGLFLNGAAGLRWRVGGADVASVNANGYDTAGERFYQVGGTKVVGARGAAIPDVALAAASPSKAEFDSLVTAFNGLLARLRASTGHGLIA